MKNEVSDVALFRYSVLGSLTSRINLAKGDVKKIINEQASELFDIPNSNRNKISARTIEKWYYKWKRQGINGLEPKIRSDKGDSKLSSVIKAQVVRLKHDHMGRSVNTIVKMLGNQGVEVSRSSVYRFLKANDLSSRVISDAPTIERRKFEAEYANDIWYGDVMHGPSITKDGKSQKVYMVSLMDDASRLIVHSCFCFNEKAESIEYVLQQALLKRGIPKRLIVDNGAAYVAKTLQQACVRIGVHLIYCRPYEPQGKAKLERWHRTVRDQFIKEINPNIDNLYDLNARLWAWIEEYYHKSPHKGLDGKSPLSRYRKDIELINPVKMSMSDFEKIFYQRISRRINKDGSFSLDGKLYEVPYELSGKTVFIGLTPSTRAPQVIEDEAGNDLGAIIDLDAKSNLHRKRQRPIPVEPTKTQESFADQILAKRIERLSEEKT
jgi:putative transposase